MIAFPTLIKAAELCTRSYDGPHTFPEASLLASFDSMLGLQAYIYQCPETRTLFVIFRGSDQGIDWLWNLFLLPNQAGVHAGYWRVYRDIEDDLVRATLRARARLAGYDTVITGHSMGGALGQLLAASLGALGERSTVVTFGSFCAGRAAFQTRLSALGVECIHFHTARDIVPRIMRLVYSVEAATEIRLATPRARDEDVRNALDEHRMAAYESALGRHLRVCAARHRPPAGPAAGPAAGPTSSG
jgi:hypothetical protein